MGSGWGEGEGGKEGWIAEEFFKVVFSAGKSVNGVMVVPQ